MRVSGSNTTFSSTAPKRLVASQIIGSASFKFSKEAEPMIWDGTKAVGGVPDHRLGFLRELDGLGVAAALEVEDAVRRPAGLVVADQRAVRIGRQRGLAGAGEAEEQRAVAVLADVRRAMHRHHA